MSSSSPNNEASRASLDLLYHISRELAGTQDLRAVLEKVLFLSMRYVGAMSGSIIVLDDNAKPVDSAIINRDTVIKDTTQQLRIMIDRGLAGWVIRNRHAALIKDTNHDERWMVRQFEGEKQVESRSAVSAPLFVRERLVGVMTLVHHKAGFFNEEHLSLFQSIADQSGIAVLNTRLLVESQRQARVMTALAETAATITGSLNLEDVLLRIMEQTSQALGVQAVSLSLLDPMSNDLIVRAAIGWANKKVINVRIKTGQGIAGWVAREGRGVVINDVSKDARFDSETNQRTGLTTRAIACAPLRYRSQVIGVLEAINPTGGSYNSDALLVLSGISSLAGTAVRHAQLFERLQAAHQSYRELFEDSIDPILITDWQGRIIEANRMAVVATEYDKNTLTDINIGQLHSLDVEQLGSKYEKLNNGKAISYESILQTMTEQEVPIQVYVHRVFIEGNAHIQWILRDITERKNLDSMREDLISMIYHDLRSPLANIASSLDVIDTMIPETDDDDNLHSLLGIAMRSVERIQRLTNSLLDMSRLEAGQQVGNRQPTDILAILEDAVTLVKPVVENKQQTAFSNLPTSLPAVMIDGEMIRRVVTNLLENASKYSPAGSTIQAGAQEKNDWVQVWVKDNGPGIPASEQEQVFKKFTRLNTKEKAKGLGLGLAFCKLAIQAHGGQIWIESEPGYGTTFFFTLPVAPPSEQ